MRNQLRSFADLFKRLSIPRPRGVKSAGPIIGSVAAADRRGHPRRPESWAIVHTVTDVGLKLIHPHPLAAKHIVVSLVAPAGETLQVLLARRQTEAIGDLCETAAEFLVSPLDPHESLGQRTGTDMHRPQEDRHPPQEDRMDPADETRWSQDEAENTGFG
ncbi:MAG TPA: hypothetical protein VND64_22805 [Pirellulales bacterium]|nr:hypothetical protein [Pirellulales bacterium]